MKQFLKGWRHRHLRHRVRVVSWRIEPKLEDNFACVHGKHSAIRIKTDVNGRCVSVESWAWNEGGCYRFDTLSAPKAKYTLTHLTTLEGGKSKKGKKKKRKANGENGTLNRFFLKIKLSLIILKVCNILIELNVFHQFGPCLEGDNPTNRQF